MHRVFKWLAVFFGLGFTPYISGSAGALGAIPLFYFLSSLGAPLYFLTLLAFTVLAIWISEMALPLFQNTVRPQDPVCIVIDEVVGYLWALGIVRYTGFWKPEEGLFWLLLIPYIFFRLFDITKWWLVGWAERKWKGGMGIVMDDVVAGIFGGVASILFCIVFPLIVYAVKSII